MGDNWYWSTRKVKQLSMWMIDYTLKITIRIITGTELSNTTVEDVLSFIEANIAEEVAELV